MIEPYKVIASYYDLLYVKNNKYSDESEQITEFISKYKLSRGNKLLDIACGTGGHISFLKENYTVFGLDICDDMLEIAKEKLPDVCFYKQDMVNFCLGNRFDIAICMYGSIGYTKTYENLQKCLRTIYLHLNPGAIFIMVPWLIAEKFKNKVVSDLNKGDNYTAVRLENIQLKGSIVEIDMHHLLEINGQIRYFNHKIESGLFSGNEYRNAINEAGFDILEEYSGNKIKLGAYVCRK